MTNESHQLLIEAALEVRKKAYAKYSGFLVGAALRTLDGQIFTGCNVENASFGLTNCAERTAVFSAVAAGCRSFTAIVIASAGGVTPCGACRQVLAEFCEDLPIFLVDANHPQKVIEINLSELLPHRFADFG